MNIPDESCQLGTKHTLEWKRFLSYHAHAQAALDKGRGDLQSDEAGANDYSFPRPSESFNDRSTIPKSAEVKNLLTAGNLEAYRRRTRGDKQTAVFATVPVTQLDRPRFDIDGFRLDTGQHLNALCVEKLSRVKRKPFLRRVPRQVILGEVGPIIRRVRIGVDHGDRSSVRLTSQHLRAGIPSRTRANDHDRFWTRRWARVKQNLFRSS